MKDAIKVDFEYEFQSLARAVSQITKFEDLWKSVKEDLLASSDTTYHWTREPPTITDKIFETNCSFHVK